MRRSRQGVLIGAAALFALCMSASGAAASELATPHAASSRLVTPHVPAPPVAEAPGEPRPSPASESTPPPSTAPPTPSAVESRLSSAAPPPESDPVGLEGPSSSPEEPGSSYPNECPGRECLSCPGSPKCPDSAGYYPEEGSSSLSDDPRYAACAGSQYLMLWAWPDNVMESQWIGYLLKGLQVSSGVDHPKFPRQHPGAFPNWSVPPTAFRYLSEMVDSWNRSCINFVSP